MTPFEIDILMHYATRIGDHDVVRTDPPIWPDTRAKLLGLGLLAISHEPGQVYERTDRLTAYARELCAVPLPVQMWVTPE